MNLACSAADRVWAAGNRRRYSQGRGSRRKLRGQANSNIVVSHPLAQFAEQCLALLLAQLHLGAIEIGGQRLQGRSPGARVDRKSTRLNSSHVRISYAVFCLKKK